ncbi:hypothetical protein [Trinickia acidisoli]|uniref:hypothetical protein n=1 Tax=Trinickia acidisoli TaxID=2767482 RepID=UPI001A8FC6F8|nr:hypothetical protein [Trinickia acidisoli]
MSDIRYDSFAQSEEALEEARSEQTQAQQQAQQTQAQQAGNDAVRFKRQRLLKMRQAAARRRAGMQLQARFAAARASAERTRGSKSQKLLSELRPRKKSDKQEKAHGEHKAHGDHKLHEHSAHSDHPHGPHAPREHGAHRRIERQDGDGRQGSGRQQQQQQEDPAPVVKVKLSKRISPSAIRSDLRSLADANEDEPLRLENQMRLAWTRTCLGFGMAISLDPKAAVTPIILGSSLDMIAARFRHAALRDATRQTGLVGVKHQLQTVQDEPEFRSKPSGELSLSDRQKDLNLLKPLFVLHGERPSTRPQLRLSVCRLRTLLFATGQTVDPAQAMQAERAARVTRARQTNATRTHERGASPHEPGNEPSNEFGNEPGPASQNF